MKIRGKVFHWIAGATVAVAMLLPAATAAQACAQFDKTGTICLCPLPGQTGTCTMTGQQPLPFASQPKFAYDLPVPIDYVPDQTSIPGVDYYEVQMSAVTQAPVAFPQKPANVTQPPNTQWLGLVDPLTRAPLFTEVWGYSQVNQPAYALNGISTYPSMSFRATKGRPVKVKWINNAPNNHLFCKTPLNSNAPCGIDRTLMGTKLNIPGGELVNQYGTIQQPDNAMVIHLHGGEIPPDSDGFAELWLGNATTAAAYSTAGPYYTPATPLLDSVGGVVPGVTSNLSPKFVPPPGSAIPADALYPTANVDPVASLIANVYQPGQLIRPLGNSVHYNYPMVQRAATIWYHDHTLGKTRVNVAAGPAGFFIVEDPVEETAYRAAFRVPSKGDCSVNGILLGNCYDVPIAIQDRAFNADGSINFPNGLGQVAPAGFVGVWNPLVPGPNPDVHPQWVPEYFGDHAVLNGVIWPRFRVEPRAYRFRLLDGSNARCYTLGLKVPGALVQPQFTHVANEQGYLPNAVVTKSFSICPGEREEVVIDFSAYAGKSVFLTNTAPAPFPGGIGVQPGGGFEGLAQLMRFDVVKPLNAAFPTTFVPGAMAAAPALPAATNARQMILNEVLDPVTLAPLRVQIDGKAFEDAATETPRRGTVERWTIVNTTVDAHPMHLHLVQFRVVARQKYDQKAFMAAVGLPGNPQNGLPLTPVSVTPYLIGNPRAPEPWEVGWKDTAKSFPGEILVLEAKWDGGWRDTPTCATPVAGAPLMTVPPAGNATCMCQPDLLNPAVCAVPETPIFNTAIPYYEAVTSGPYVWHCHIVDHEDNEMMRPTLVMP